MRPHFNDLHQATNPEIVRRQELSFEDASMRTSSEVLRRAVVMTTVAFRASLEATIHPRSRELSQRLLPWLESLGMAGDIDPIEHDLLATPFGELETSQKTDAKWSGEGAFVM